MTSDLDVKDDDRRDICPTCVRRDSVTESEAIDQDLDYSTDCEPSIWEVDAEYTLEIQKGTMT
jgi:hypothetical protein